MTPAATSFCATSRTEPSGPRRFQPIGVEPDGYQVTFTEDRAEIIRTDGAFITTLHVVVSPEVDAEVRCVSIANTWLADLETSTSPRTASSCWRRPRPTRRIRRFPRCSCRRNASPRVRCCSRRGGGATRTSPRSGFRTMRWWRAKHGDAGIRDRSSPLSGSRARNPRSRCGHGWRAIVQFRGHGPRSHFRVALPGANRAGRYGAPLRSGRRRHPPRAAALALYDKHHESNAFVRAADAGVDSGAGAAASSGRYGRRGDSISADRRSCDLRGRGHAALLEEIRRGAGTAAALWAQSISGDLPIVLLRIDDLEDIAVVRQLLRAHEYWRLKQLTVDLVIVNERGPPTCRTCRWRWRPWYA